MKRSQTDKLAGELAALERRLREELLQILPGVAESGSNPFTNSQFNPSNLHAHHFHPDAESLLRSAQECIRLREALGLDSVGPVAAVFLTACEEHASTNQQRRGPRKLAAALLQVI